MGQATIPGIQLGQELGRGGASVVYSALRIADERPVAVKLVQPEQTGMRLVERALQEAEICWALDHPHVVRVLDWGVLPAGQAYLVLELLNGRDLAHWILEAGPLSMAATLRVAHQAARGLGAIHARGIVHRDIKPENLFLCRDGPGHDHLKILDLGIAGWAAGSMETMAGMVFGTPGFMAPEQARGEKVDQRADLFSLGATLFCCLTARLPFAHQGDKPLQIINRTARATEAPTLPDHLPARFADILRDCLDPNPCRRPISTQAFLASLTGAAEDVAGSSASTTVTIGPETIEVGDLHLPTLGDCADHQRFRERVVLAIAQIFRPGHLPRALQVALTEADRLHEEQARARDRARGLRANASRAAMQLADRRRRLSAAIQQVEERLSVLHDGLVLLTRQLMRHGDHLADLDLRYLMHYRKVETLQQQAANEAALREEPLRLEGLFDQAVRRAYSVLESLDRQRREVLSEQEQQRAELDLRMAASADLHGQLCELKRSQLGLDLERDTQVFGLERAARVAEDVELRLGQQIEHVFLQLGVALQRALVP